MTQSRAVKHPVPRPTSTAAHPHPSSFPHQVQRFEDRHEPKRQCNIRCRIPRATARLHRVRPCVLPLTRLRPRLQTLASTMDPPLMTTVDASQNEDAELAGGNVVLKDNSDWPGDKMETFCLHRHCSFGTHVPLQSFQPLAGEQNICCRPEVSACILVCENVLQVET